MQTDDRPSFDWRDIAVATGLLTRIPVSIDDRFAAERGGFAAWAYPLAGVCVGVLPIMVSIGFQGLGTGVAVGLGLLTLITLTGAMHEDGLADSADGLWGGWTKQRRLDIMKDSRIGVYGVLALVLFVLIRWSALGTLLEAGMIWIWLAALAISRAAMVWIMVVLPNARDGGLSASVGRPLMVHAWCATLISSVPLVFFAPGAIILGATALLAAGAAGLIARSKIGGQTGDILGATAILVETALLVVATGFV